MIYKYVFILLLLVSQVAAFTQPAGIVPGQLIIQLAGNASQQDIEKKLLTQGFHVQLSVLSKNMHILLVEFDTLEYAPTAVFGTLQSMREISHTQYNHTLQNRNIPDDSNFSLQWNMLNAGSGGTDDADIDADEAWDITTGGFTIRGDSILIAIVDDGFDFTHNDLRFQKNYFEIPDNGTDDDGNGYIDDYDGWNASAHNDNITSASHGTHVSGIAAALGDNALGVAGINWSCKVLPVQCDVIESEVIEAYDYLLSLRKLYNATNGEKGYFIVVQNSSFGIDLVNPDDYPLWCAMYDSLGNAGILTAAATTNGNYNVDVVGDMPTACPSDYLISVTNTNKFDQLLSGGYGVTTIDLGAPGTSIYSTIATNNYGTQTGTSMSSPHVAGAVALLMSRACGDFLDDYAENPAIILALKNYILESVDTLEDLKDKSVSGGRLNLYNALLRLESAYCPNTITEPKHLTDAVLFPNPTSLQVFIRFNDVTYAGQLLRIELTSLLGNKIAVQQHTPEQLQNEGMNISKYPAATYLLSLFDENNLRIFSYPVIVQ
jgi:subtilisin family serine protease